MTLYISAEKINSRSPYLVEQLDATSFSFTTKEGLTYFVGFSPDQSFVEEGAYQFYLVEKDHRRGPFDSCILETITIVIEEFFCAAPGIMMYICDTSDQLHAVRNRLFQFWFSSYRNNSQYVLVTEDVTIDDNTYYAGLMLQKTHPQLGEIIQLFHQFIIELPDKLNSL